MDVEAEVLKDITDIPRKKKSSQVKSVPTYSCSVCVKKKMAFDWFDSWFETQASASHHAMMKPETIIVGAKA
mgnify:FL=1